MKPETLKLWGKVLTEWDNVNELSREGKLQEAASSAPFVLLFANKAIHTLSQELKMPDLSKIADNIFMDVFEKMEKHRTPKEIIEWVYERMKWVSDELPPDTFRPIK